MSFGKWESILLTAENRRHFWIPEGFAHGCEVLSEKATFIYLCTETYDREADAGIRWNDPALAIDWPVAEPLLSDKDMRAPLLADVAADRLPVYAPCGSCYSARTGRSAPSCSAASRRWARSLPPRPMACLPAVRAARSRISTAPTRSRR